LAIAIAISQLAFVITSKYKPPNPLYLLITNRPVLKSKPAYVVDGATDIQNDWLNGITSIRVLNWRICSRNSSSGGGILSNDEWWQ
jgi:hypothetical protein